MKTTSNREGETIMAKLSPEQITEKLRTLAGWERKGETIAKQYTFKEFMDGIRFINRIAEIAEQMDHHPDIAVNYRRITFTLSTHDQGGITEKDFKLADAIESEFKSRA
jgi:4a-hydroxytetrahydrobiopterin dehydratase